MNSYITAEGLSLRLVESVYLKLQSLDLSPKATKILVYSFMEYTCLSEGIFKR